LVSFKLQSWSAFAPGLENKTAWAEWLLSPHPLPAELLKVSLKQIPPMLRRRFTELGKCVASAALPLLDDIEPIPGVFASRHGDTHLTLSLLEGIADQSEMSPTGFSLAVHNAVSGLLSIARKDVSAVTAIAATEALIPHALLEAVTQLQDSEQVLCVIYDVPLPALYRSYCMTEVYPFAVAMIVSRDEGESVVLDNVDASPSPEAGGNDTERLLRFLCGLDTQAFFGSVGSDWHWRLFRE
jgi:hypothetical protein